MIFIALRLRVVHTAERARAAREWQMALVYQGVSGQAANELVVVVEEEEEGGQ
jgi:hypothetical protein